jgi:hypothetical protein
MAKRQRQWAKRKTSDLRVALGNKCAQCGHTANLEFDCIQAMGHAHHVLGVEMRYYFYRQQNEAGNLQLLCKACHEPKSKAEADWVRPRIGGSLAERAERARRAKLLTQV